MITDLKEEILTNAFNNIGFGDIVNQNVPVIVKRDFAVDDCYVIKANTIGCIKKHNVHKAEYNNGFVIDYLTFKTPEKELNIEIKSSLENNEVRVCSLAEDISLTDLLTIYDGKAASAIKEYCEIDDNLFICSCEYDRNIESKKELSVFGAFAVLICALMSANFMFSLLFVFLLAVDFCLNNKSYYDTEEAKLMREKKKNLAEEVKIEEQKEQ